MFHEDTTTYVRYGLSPHTMPLKFVLVGVGLLIARFVIIQSIFPRAPTNIGAAV